MKWLLSMGWCLCPLGAMADVLVTATSQNDAVGNITLELVQSSTNNPDNFAWTILETNGTSNRGFIEIIAPGGEPTNLVQPSGWTGNVHAEGDQWRVTWVYDGTDSQNPDEAIIIDGNSITFQFFSEMDQIFQNAPTTLPLPGKIFGRRPTGLPRPFPAFQFATAEFVTTASLEFGGNTPPTAIGFNPETFDIASGDHVIDLTSGFEDVEDGASGLSYAVLSSTFAELFTSVSIDNTSNTLTLCPHSHLLGSAKLTLQATDTLGLQVTTAIDIEVTGNAYLQWLNAHFPPSTLINAELEPTVWGLAADSDGDQMSNIAEAYHNTIPDAANAFPFESAGVDSDDLTFQWTRGPSDHGVTASLQWSINLTDWFNDGEVRSFDVFPPTPTAEGFEFSGSLPAASSERVFVRLTYHTP